MNDLDWIPGEADATRPEREPRRHRHVWVTFEYELIGHEGMRSFDGCARCGKPRDEAGTRRGRSARRLGNDQERRAERVYGWRKVGEYGGITDLQGRLFKVQQKATRAAPPKRWQAIFRALDTVNDGRVPALLLSYVRQGVPTEDYVILRGADFLDLHGRDEG